MRPSQTVALQSRVRRFLGNSSGVAAVEFAYLVPLLMLMTFGTFEITRALVVHKRFQRATAMVGDLVSREEQLGTTSATAKSALDGIMLSVANVMAPYSSTPLKLGVYQFRANSTDATQTRVEWSYAYNSMTVQACSLTYATNSLVPPNMLSAGDAAIIVDARYQYTPVLTNVLPGLLGLMNWSDTMTFSPRYGSVFYGQATQNTTCP